MAYSTGSYTDQNDALDQWRAFLLAQGWTINNFIDDGSKYSGDVFTGKRLHVQKNINGTDYFFNFRSCSNQRVFEYSSYDNVTGICVNGSTGYNAGQPWDTQPGHTDRNLFASQDVSIGGCVDEMVETGGNFTFYATATTASAQFLTESTFVDDRFMSIGVTSSGRPQFHASGGYNTGIANGDFRSSFLADFPNSVYGTSGHYESGEGWYLGCRDVSGDGTIAPQFGFGITIVPSGSYAASYIAYSPDPSRGNAPLPLLNTNLFTPELKSSGIYDGINFINMKNYSNGQEITIGSDTFVLFRITNDTGSDRDQMGVAFKK